MRQRSCCHNTSTEFITDPDCWKGTHEGIRLLDFINAVLDLKEVRRQGWINVGIPDAESVADHTFSTSMITMILSDKAGCDTERAMKMAMLHDMAESVTGDIIPGVMPSEKKRAQESKVIDQMISRLPDAMRESYRAIWREYVDCQTDEAILVHNADKLDMAIQAKRYGTLMAPDALASFLKSAKDAIIDSNPKLLIDEVRL